ncbi:ectonucleotide pyrophosphatase/phosphodiesterase [Clostridiaceae bacterium M8S5]|nr:ectonucleotide pyrophosphatase/phosphodiesterase [Clostridiaceae bacterium M8S5]
MHLIVISFDGLSTKDFKYISRLENFKSVLKDASYCTDVESVYPTLTYPAHVSIVTGKYPKNHGVVNNTLLQPNRQSPDWYWHRKYIKGETFYDLAIKDGKTVSALLWPVTAKSKIQYNVPEIFANRPYQNQIIVSLLNGSIKYQYKLNKMFGHLRKGLKQPYLDNFTHQSFLYTLKNIKPDISLVHYTDLDSMRHYNGFDSIEALDALKRHDRRLGEIIRTLKELNIYEESTLILLGDHSSMDESKVVYLNVYLKEKGFIKVNKKGKVTSYDAIAKSCDGSTYIYMKDKSNKQLKDRLFKDLCDFNKHNNCFDDIYTSKEAIRLGADSNCTFMIEATEDYYFLDDLDVPAIKEISLDEVGNVPHITKATHGYLPSKEGYGTVFIARGKRIKKGNIIDKMRLIDEGPTIAKLLGYELKEADGQVINDFLDI